MDCFEEMYEIFGLQAVIIFDCLSAYKALKKANESFRAPALLEAKNYYQHAIEFHSGEPLTLDSLGYQCIEKIENELIKEGVDV